jgi:hypothetical protein
MMRPIRTLRKVHTAGTLPKVENRGYHVVVAHHVLIDHSAAATACTGTTCTTWAATTMTTTITNIGLSIRNYCQALAIGSQSSGVRARKIPFGAAAHVARGQAGVSPVSQSDARTIFVGVCQHL